MSPGPVWFQIFLSSLISFQFFLIKIHFSFKVSIFFCYPFLSKSLFVICANTSFVGAGFSSFVNKVLLNSTLQTNHCGFFVDKIFFQSVEARFLLNKIFCVLPNKTLRPMNFKGKILLSTL